MLKKFNTIYESIINEMNENSFYPAKYTDGTQAVGTNFQGDEQIWMIGPTMERKLKDFLTGEALPQYTTILWLPNKLGIRKGIAISINSYEANKESMKDKLAELGLVKDIDWENSGSIAGEY